MKGASLRLKFFEDRGQCVVEVAAGDEKPERLSACTWERTTVLRDELAQALRDARKALGKPGGKCDLAQAHGSLNAINQAGLDVLQQLLGRNLRKVYEYFRAATDRAQIAPHRQVDFPVIEIQMPINFIQLEVLPLAELSELPAAFNTDDDLARAVTRFPGFSFVTRRIVPENQIPQDALLRGAPRVPVKMFRNTRFPGSHIEARVLGRNFALDGEGPWPDVPGRTAHAAVSAMVHCDKDFLGSSKSTIDQIHHFSCHSARLDNDHFLELRAEGDMPIRVFMSPFNRAVAIENARSTDYERPFAFLNACVTNSPSSESLATWTDTLLWAGYRGVIGTEAPAPDLFASTFSCIFYGELVTRQTVGQALQRAKWKMLERWRNPMGLLYTLFGNPDLRIS
jgi:hypothetical protein